MDENKELSGEAAPKVEETLKSAGNARNEASPGAPAELKIKTIGIPELQEKLHRAMERAKAAKQ